MDRLFIYVTLIVVGMGSLSILLGFCFRHAKCEIIKKIDVIGKKQDAIMAKLIEIKNR